MSDHKKSKIPNVLNRENTADDELSAFERWELPFVDGELVGEPTGNAFSSKEISRKIAPNGGAQSSDEPDESEEDIKPLTAEDLEAIRQAAYEEGKEQGQQDGYKAGYDQGYKSGEADVKAAVTKLAQISRALLEPIPSQDDELESAVLQLVENICTRVVHRELKLDSNSVLLVIKEAINCLNAGSKRIRIHLNPEDADFVIQALKDAGEWDDSWRVLPHQTISPGGCIVDTDNAVVDMRAERRLASVIKQVYEKDQKVLEEKTAKHEGGLDQLMGEVDSFNDEDIDPESELDDIEDLSSGSDPSSPAEDD